MKVDGESKRMNLKYCLRHTTIEARTASEEIKKIGAKAQKSSFSLGPSSPNASDFAEGKLQQLL